MNFCECFFTLFLKGRVETILIWSVVNQAESSLKKKKKGKARVLAFLTSFLKSICFKILYVHFEFWPTLFVQLLNNTPAM